MGSYLTFITGVATLLGFILQIKDIFPQHREARKGILYVFFGIFVGSILGAVNSIDIKLSEHYGLVSTVLIGILIVVAFTLVVMTFVAFNTEEPRHRSDFFNGIGFGVFIFFLILIACAFSTSSARPNEQYSKGEILAAAKFNSESKNYERAISLYESVTAGYQTDDPRRKKIEEIIESTKKEMTSGL